ncbi:MAG: glycosyltransferase [Thermodesulfovibrionia bacterium]|nr:glycosyltransferase [Thermodesulfovibrionia bacterium]
MPESGLSVEIVIPSYNRLNILKDTIYKIRQLYPAVGICLGLQGDMPDDELQAQFESDPNLRIEKLPEPGTTRALNRCIFSSAADIALSLDDDAYPVHGWIEAHVSAFMKDPELVYTSGRVIELTKRRPMISDLARIMAESVFGLFMGKDKKIDGRIVGWVNRFGLLFGNFDKPGTCRINSPREGNMGIRREIFQKTGGFDNAFRGNAAFFGADFGLRMAKEGIYGLYIGDAIIIHHEFPSGGSREAGKAQWLRDYIFNHKLFIKHLGSQAWIGSIPRLLKRLF